MCDTSNTSKHRWDRDKISARPATNKTGALCPHNDSKDGYQPEPARVPRITLHGTFTPRGPGALGAIKKSPWIIKNRTTNIYKISVHDITITQQQNTVGYTVGSESTSGYTNNIVEYCSVHTNLYAKRWFST